jgi:hypothetical protein
MRVPEASGAGLRTAIRLGLPSGNCLSRVFGRRSGARTKSTKGALVHMNNPDCRITVEPLSGYRRVTVGRAPTGCPEAAIFFAPFAKREARV